MANKIKLKTSKSKHVLVFIWADTKERLARVAKKRGDTLSKYIDELSKVELK